MVLQETILARQFHEPEGVVAVVDDASNAVSATVVAAAVAAVAVPVAGLLALGSLVWFGTLAPFAQLFKHQQVFFQQPLCGGSGGCEAGGREWLVW